MTGDSQAKSLSIVVAAQQAGSSLSKCLASLSAQLSPAKAEILVADGSQGHSRNKLEEQFPSVRFLQLPPGTNVPRLWSAGIAASGGRIVALTIEQCVPASGWAEQILQAHAAQWPAIGGAMDIDPSAGLTDWAVYFCRYSRNIPPFSPRFLDDLPGDNCSYKRAALESVREQMKEGFWETFVHQALRARGGQLLSDPSIVVRYGGSFSWFAFLQRRFQDARYFAARCAREMTAPARFTRAASFFIVPSVMFGRIAARVWRNRRYRGKLLVVTPLLAPFLVAWATGECLGYIFGPPEGMMTAPEKSAAWDRIA